MRAEMDECGWPADFKADHEREERLRDAAPEMLATLKRIVADHGHMTTENYDAACAVIARAEGIAMTATEPVTVKHRR